ncbi:MAG: Serine/threonine-protein phosphatase 2A 56 kDa regulatory subunit beta isoform [Marteilia pararefringens]
MGTDASGVTIDEIEDMFNNKWFNDHDIFENEDESSDIYLENITLLHELRSTINENPTIFCPRLYQLIVKFFEVHIYESYSFKPAPVYEIDMEEEETYITNKIAEKLASIEFIISIIDSPNFSVDEAKRIINIQFVYKILNSFYCEDIRIRDMLKNLLHKIYTKFLNMRGKIRNRIKIMFQEIVATKALCRGLDQILDILSSIITGFVKPLKEEHKLLLKDGLVLLLKMPNLSQFDQKLSFALMYFCEKDSDCLDIVLDSMLKYWPKTAPNKEQKFIYYLNELLIRCEEESLNKFRERIMIQIRRCLKSDHCQLIEQTLKLMYESLQISRIIEFDTTKYLKQIIECRPDIKPEDWNGTLLCYFKELEELYAKKFGDAYYQAKSAAEHN